MCKRCTAEVLLPPRWRRWRGRLGRRLILGWSRSTSSPTPTTTRHFSRRARLEKDPRLHPSSSETIDL
eukprot:9472030-Pyramimonas_sp.AAC.1